MWATGHTSRARVPVRHRLLDSLRVWSSGSFSHIRATYWSAERQIAAAPSPAVDATPPAAADAIEGESFDACGDVEHGGFVERDQV